MIDPRDPPITLIVEIRFKKNMFGNCHQKDAKKRTIDAVQYIIFTGEK